MKCKQVLNSKNTLQLYAQADFLQIALDYTLAVTMAYCMHPSGQHQVTAVNQNEEKKMLYSFNTEQNQDPDGKAFYSNTLDGVTSYCGYCPIIFSLLKCRFGGEIHCKEPSCKAGKVNFLSMLSFLSLLAYFLFPQFLTFLPLIFQIQLKVNNVIFLNFKVVFFFLSLTPFFLLGIFLIV